MSAVAFCMDLLLASLLLAALFVGLRLERRLKVLRESQAGFAGAVIELNGAVARAQEGLAELKIAALDAQTTIADRLQDAKGMSVRLEKQAAAAGEAAERLDRMLEKVVVATAAVERVRSQTAHPRASGDPGVLSLHMKVPDSPLRREALSRTSELEERSQGPRLRGDERGGAAAPRRAPADDDLFDIIEPALKAARGMGR